MTDVVHPPWCSPEHCTAPAAEPTTEEWHAKDRGKVWAHRSAPIPLPSSFAAEPPVVPLVFFLSRAVAPWRCGVFVTIERVETDPHTGEKLDPGRRRVAHWPVGDCYLRQDPLAEALQAAIAFEVGLDEAGWAERTGGRR